MQRAAVYATRRRTDVFRTELIVAVPLAHGRRRVNDVTGFSQRNTTPEDVSVLVHLKENSGVRTWRSALQEMENRGTSLTALRIKHALTTPGQVGSSL